MSLEEIWHRINTRWDTIVERKLLRKGKSEWSHVDICKELISADPRALGMTIQSSKQEEHGANNFKYEEAEAIVF